MSSGLCITILSFLVFVPLLQLQLQLQQSTTIMTTALASSSSNSKLIYGIPGSGWTHPNGIGVLPLVRAMIVP